MRGHDAGQRQYGAVENVAGSAGNTIVRHTEGVPAVLLEAMQCGVPVVAAAVGGVPDVLEGGRCGVLVPPARPDQLALAVVRVSTDSALRRELIGWGRRRIAAFASDVQLQAFRSGIARLTGVDMHNARDEPALM